MDQMEAAKAHPPGEVDEMGLRAAACTLAINLVRPQKVVGNLKEGCDGGQLVSMAARPIAHVAKRRQHGVIQRQKELFAARGGPL